MYTPDPVGGDNTCSSCDSKEVSVCVEVESHSHTFLQDLWICLICGVVGCGRYMGGHANKYVHII